MDLDRKSKEAKTSRKHPSHPDELYRQQVERSQSAKLGLVGAVAVCNFIIKLASNKSIPSIGIYIM